MGIGSARRDALALALETDCTHVAYSDLDHVLRWASLDARELHIAMTPTAGADFVVIGRSPSAFAAEPHRLRMTEGAVNQAASLALGLRVEEEARDFMMATPPDDARDRSSTRR